MSAATAEANSAVFRRSIPFARPKANASQEGKAIIFCSSELPEILAMCDRIFLLYEGRIKATMSNSRDIQSDRLLHLCTGGD